MAGSFVCCSMVNLTGLCGQATTTYISLVASTPHSQTYNWYGLLPLRQEPSSTFPQGKNNRPATKRHPERWPGDGDSIRVQLQ